MPRKKSYVKKRQTNSTNDKSAQKQPNAVDWNIDHKGAETDLSLSDVDSDVPTHLKQGTILGGNEEELRIKSSSEDNHQSETKETTHTEFRRNIIESKELLQFRKDNIIYFIASDGSLCDNGSRVLIEANKIPANQTVCVGKIGETRRSNNKYLFGLCIRGENPEPQQIVKNNLGETLTLLRESLTTKKVKEFSIAKTPYIENIPWVDVIEIFKTTFKNDPIKIIICKGTLQYVTEDRRDQIFKELHSSPIGGHRGVSKTFHRIRQDFFWENLKQDIQRRIQQCIPCQLKKLVRLKTKQPMVITHTRNSF